MQWKKGRKEVSKETEGRKEREDKNATKGRKEGKEERK